jgi:hypothetical protein
MKPWNLRPPDVARLFNPAFCGRLLAHAVVEHRPEPVPFALVPLILPLVLHRKTRESLPTSVRSPFITWVEENAEVRIGLADRVARALPVTRESLLFMTSRGWLSFERGAVSAPQPRPPHTRPRDTDEIKDCILKARLIGRWLAHAGRPATIYAALAITP